jgi:hypothetical protein
MRISVDKNDPGYVTDSRRYDVLDSAGIKLLNVITVDTDEGYILQIYKGLAGPAEVKIFGNYTIKHNPV